MWRFGGRPEGVVGRRRRGVKGSESRENVLNGEGGLECEIRMDGHGFG